MKRKQLIGGILCLVVAGAMFLYPGTKETVALPIILTALGVTLIAITRSPEQEPARHISLKCGPSLTETKNGRYSEVSSAACLFENHLFVEGVTHMLADCGRRRICLQRPVLIVAVLLTASVVAGCGATGSAPSPAQEKPLSKEGTHQIGAWRYDYSVANKGTRSEGYDGKLFYHGQALAASEHINDYYETPWGRIYWVGQPTVLFGNHGWMTSPLAREPVGQALADPATLAEKFFVVRLKILTAEELGSPDRRESERAALDALRPFGLQQAHVQRNWFQAGHEWITLHNTKRWGLLELRLADPNQGTPLAITLRSTGDLTVETTPQENPFEALLSPPTTPGTPKIVPLPPQAEALRVVKCTLSGFPFDTLELFLLCRIEASKTNPSQY